MKAICISFPIHSLLFPVIFPLAAFIFNCKSPLYILEISSSHTDVVNHSLPIYHPFFGFAEGISY